MIKTLIVASIGCGLILLRQSTIERAAWPLETVRIAPASDGVELDEIHIVRQIALGVVKEADLTNMQLRLWFAAEWETKDNRSPTLIYFQQLGAIEDDTGRLLSTEKRLKGIEHLGGEVRGNTWKRPGGKQGPVVTLLLDAPARGANKLKAIKGKAQVTLTKTVNLTFQDLAAINGKILDHPDMESLKGQKLRFSITEKDGRVSAKISAPVNFASPWNRGRLDSWELMDGDTRISLSSEGKSMDSEEEFTVEKTYRRRAFKDLSLRLVVLEAVESKTFSFDFQNVDLP